MRVAVLRTPKSGIPGNRESRTAAPPSPRRGRLICSLGREPVERRGTQPSRFSRLFEPQRGD